MKRKFNVTVWLEERIYVAQCLEVDIASQGRSVIEARSNLAEALQLHFECLSTPLPEIKTIEVEVNDA